jgi:hypothetical protein
VILQAHVAIFFICFCNPQKLNHTQPKANAKVQQLANICGALRDSKLQLSACKSDALQIALADQYNIS